MLKERGNKVNSPVSRGTPQPPSKVSLLIPDYVCFYSRLWNALTDGADGYSTET